MSTEQDVRIWVRDESKKIIEAIRMQEDTRELAHANQVAELRMQLQRANSSNQLDNEQKAWLVALALVVLGLGLCLGAFLIDPSDAEECVGVCKTAGVAKYVPDTQHARSICECKP